MADIHLAGTLCRLRPYRTGDVDAMIAVANDPLVTRWMTASFSYPYTRAHAQAWIAKATSSAVTEHFVIEAGGEFAGAAGAEACEGEHEGVAVFGYWLGRRFWGRGIATDAARTLSNYALSSRAFRRLEASVFAPNVASSRVLEKSGFTLEARVRDSYRSRDGSICDAFLYARLASDAEPRE